MKNAKGVKVEVNNGILTLSAGLKTHAKLDYINANSPIKIRAIAGEWYVGRVTFFDGIKIHIACRKILNYNHVTNLKPTICSVKQSDHTS